jgi:hypothetical protein
VRRRSQAAAAEDTPRTIAEARKAAPRPKQQQVTAQIPIDPVNELVVIAAACVEPKVRRRLLATCPIDSFLAPGHAEIMAALAELDRRGLSFDPATLAQLSAGRVDPGYVEEIVRQRPEVPPNLGHHLECLHWDRARAEAARGPVAALLEALRDQLAEPDRVRALARQVAAAFDGHGQLRYLRDPQQLVREQSQAIEQRRKGFGYYPFGLEGFDEYGPDEARAGRRRLVRGMAPKLVSVVTALPGSGKSTVVAALAVAQANMQRRTLYAAWEGDSGPTLELCALISLGMSRTAFAEGAIDDADKRAVDEEMERLSEYLRFFDLPFDRSRGEKRFNDRALDTIHGYIVESGASVAIFDLWRRALVDYRPDEEEKALYRQQAIAKETHTHNVLVHQMTLKDVEKRPDKRPTREALKGSGAWVEVPDFIFGIYREALWKDVDDVTIEIDILKQRDGLWPLAVEFDFDGDTGAIRAGRGIPYQRQASVDAVDGFLDAPQEKDDGGKRRRRGGR